MVGGKSIARSATVQAIAIILLIVNDAWARDYTIKPSGKQRGVVPNYMGVGFSFAHDEGNTFIWMKYLQANLGRIFVSPLSAAWDSEDANLPARLSWEWRKFAGNQQSSTRLAQYGDQFGVSFAGKLVGDQGAWMDAASQLRSAPGSGDFFEWLVAQPAIDWAAVLKPLTSGSRVAFIGQVGIPENYVRNMQQDNIQVMALWDVRCHSLPYISTDRNDPEYWKERWETYRLMYIGGRWLAKMGITSTELYNEPDKDTDCIDGPKWVDDMRIRSQALQEAFQDHNAATGQSLSLKIAAPPLSVSWRDTYSQPFVQYFNTPFPNDQPVDGWSLANVYSYHKYGMFSKNPCTTFGPSCKSEPGYGLRKAYDVAVAKLKEAGRNVPVQITEFNCYTALGSDNADQPYMAGQRVIDNTATAACAAAQVGALVRFEGGPDLINIHKIVQTLHPTLPSRTAKNGILYANIYTPPYYITSSSKTGEAYRLLCRAKGKPVMGYSSPNFDMNLKSIRFTVWGIEEDKVYQVYVTNEGWETHNLNLDMTKFNVDPLAYAVVTAVAQNHQYGSHYHGEVSYMQPLGDSRSVKFEVSETSFYMITVPKVAADRIAAEAVADATLYANGLSSGTETNLQVSSTEGPYVAVMRFNPDIGDKSIVTSVLQLHLEKSTGQAPQLLLVLGVNEQVDEGKSWDQYSTLLPGKIPTSTADNFINWRGNSPPMVVGHMTVPGGGNIPPEGMMLRLDVTDAVKAGIRNFLVVRMFRYDQSTGAPPVQLPADWVDGVYTFTSRESDNAANRPTLFVDYEVPPRPSPPPAPSPPPEPIPYYSPDPTYDVDGGYDFSFNSPPSSYDEPSPDTFDPNGFYYDEPSPSPIFNYGDYSSPPPPPKRRPPPPKKKPPPVNKPKTPPPKRRVPSPKPSKSPKPIKPPKPVKPVKNKPTSIKNPIKKPQVVG